MRPRIGPPIPGAPWTQFYRPSPVAPPSGGEPQTEPARPTFLFDENARTLERLAAVVRQQGQVLNDLMRAGRLTTDFVGRGADIAIDDDLVTGGLGYTPVPPTRRVIAGTGLAGGGTLDRDVTIWALPDTTRSHWVSITRTYADLAAANVLSNVAIYTLEPKKFVEVAVMKHTAAFAGGGILSYTLSIGAAGTTQYIIPDFDVFNAPSNNLDDTPPGFALSSGGFNLAAGNGGNVAFVSFNQPTTVSLFATSTGANLDQATSGAVDVWLKIGQFPL
jgi:hypothetical protein